MFVRLLLAPGEDAGAAWPHLAVDRHRLHPHRLHGFGDRGAPVPKVLAGLKPVEIPEGYRVNLGVFTNLAVAVLGVALIVYLFQGM